MFVGVYSLLTFRNHTSKNVFRACFFSVSQWMKSTDFYKCLINHLISSVIFTQCIRQNFNWSPIRTALKLSSLFVTKLIAIFSYIFLGYIYLHCLPHELPHSVVKIGQICREIFSGETSKIFLDNSFARHAFVWMMFVDFTGIQKNTFFSAEIANWFWQKNTMTFKRVVYLQCYRTKHFKRFFLTDYLNGLGPFLTMATHILKF